MRQPQAKARSTGQTHLAQTKSTETATGSVVETSYSAPHWRARRAVQ
jgi:hypothetical protein